MESVVISWTKLKELKQTEIDTLSGGFAGAYRLSYQHDDGNIYVFYLGQSNDIKTRLIKHISNDEDNICVKNFVSTKKCYFRYAEIPQDDVRKATLRLMYKKYAPPCIEKMPEGREDIQVNLS